MNKDQFMKQLAKKLKRLPKEEQDEAMNYYTEYFLDAGVDDTTDVTTLVGKPEAVAAKIMDECLDKQLVKVNKEGGVKNNSKALKYMILGLIVSPVAVPLCTALIIIIFTIFITALAVIISLLVASIGVTLVGVAILPFVFWSTSVPQLLLVLGSAFICIASGVLMFTGFYKLGELLIRGLISLFSAIGKKIIYSRLKGAEQ